MLPPIGKSDHNVVDLSSNFTRNDPVGYKHVQRRDLNFDSINRIASDLVSFAWQKLYCLDDCQKQADLFYELMTDVIDRHAPLRLVKIKNNDKPWITEYFKQLVERRDVAYKNGSTVLYKKLRNQVNRVQKRLKTQYYLDQVNCLKRENSKNWWQQIKILSGAIDTCSGNESFAGITCKGEHINSEKLPEVLNNFCVSHSRYCAA